MGEYIRNRQLMDGSERTEIKIGVTTKDISDWSLNFPLIMLKEFDFLGFEDYYGGWNDSHFLRQAIANFEKTATFNWLNLPRINSWDSWSIYLTAQVSPGYHGRTDRWRFMINRN